MKDIDKAKELLVGDTTCVLVKGDKIIMSTKSGIVPIMEMIENHTDLNGFSVADKIVGKAAAMLFKKVGIVEVYAQVLSAAGKEYLNCQGIDAHSGKTVDYIINRAKTGMCPMEETVKDITDYEKAYLALKEKIMGMKKWRNKQQEEKI